MENGGKRPGCAGVPEDAVLVLIGDLVGSRQSGNRAALQARFVEAIARCNAARASIVSPYTVTLGDEFQAVFRSARGVFLDLTRVAAELLGAANRTTADPLAISIRYSLAVGRLNTPINASHAIGMDGPAFHAARTGIEQLKQSGDSFVISGLGDELDELCNGSLALVSHGMRGWSPRRHWVLAERLRGNEVSAIAELLGISPAAVYKNLSQGGVNAVCRSLLAVERMVEVRLGRAEQNP